MSKESFIGGDYIETTGGSTKVYAGEDIENSSAKYFAQKGDETGVVYAVNDEPPKIDIIKKVIRIEITSEITGYTIQGVKGLNYYFSDPAVVVPTYKANVLYLELDAKDQEKNKENKGSFNVTRDSWYSLGKENGKIKLLNRAFVPLDYAQNLYSVFWIPSYPNQLRYMKSGLDAFIFTRFGNRKIPAQPLPTQKHVDGTYIDHYRYDEKIASDVMIHVGGTYRFKGINYLGGSYGCFGFIEEKDIFSTPALAEQASLNDAYDETTTNKEWKKEADNIIKLSFGLGKTLQILLQNRDETKNYFPPKILQE